MTRAVVEDSEKSIATVRDRALVTRRTDFWWETPASWVEGNTSHIVAYERLTTLVPRSGFV